MGIFGNMFKLQPQSDEEAKRSAQVMENLKKYRGEETGKWLSMMQRDPANIPKPGAKPTVQDVDQRDTLDEAPYTPPVSAQYTTASYNVEQLTTAMAQQEGVALPQNAYVEWVNKLFSDFAVQASNFNSSAQGTHLIVTVHAPEFEWEAPKLGEYSAVKRVAGFKGYLATLQWGMLVQGSAQKIDIFVVPSEEILTFELSGLNKSGYTPFMTIDTSAVESEGVWMIGGSAITFDTIPMLVQELLGDLVRVATGSMDEKELFAHQQAGLKLGHSVAQGYASAPQPTGASSVVTGAAAMPLPASLSRMSCWSTSEQFLSAIDQDMPWLVQLKSDVDAANDAEKSKQLEDLITRLRSVSGVIAGLRADYYPSKGSRYNAS